MKTLDLRNTKPQREIMRSDINWLLAFALAFTIITVAVVSNLALDHGCALDNIITWQGVVCIK